MENINNHLLASKERVLDELASSEGDGLIRHVERFLGILSLSARNQHWSGNWASRLSCSIVCV